MSRNDSSFQDCNGFDNVDKNTQGLKLVKESKSQDKIKIVLILLNWR